MSRKYGFQSGGRRKLLSTRLNQRLISLTTPSKSNKESGPIIVRKAHSQPSIFTPVGLLREARRQKSLPEGHIPDICLLDPDGDFSRHLLRIGAKRNPNWACYHTEMFELETEAGVIGVVGCAVGASFAVLVAEQLFASGCQLLVSITSAGQIVPVNNPPYFVLIDRALRDEGTSYHYLPASDYVTISPDMLELGRILLLNNLNIKQGGAWTTDAPFRETDEAISYARSEGLLAVEMEAAALYAFAEAKKKSVICFAHVTNQMATVENDFEKGEADGNKAMLELIEHTIHAWKQTS